VIGALLLAMTVVSVQQSITFLTFGPTNSLYRYSVAQAPGVGAGGAPTGRVIQARFASAHLHGALRTVYLYLPASYATHPAQRYPTLYLLHGSPGGPYDWFGAAHAASIADALIASGRMRETILVLPDGVGPVFRSSEWANSYDGRQRIEDAITQDLVAYVDAQYRTLPTPTYRAIGGLSEGGYGAANIALHHPELFGAAIVLSGYYMAQGPVFGPSSDANAVSYRRYNSPLLYLQTPAGIQAAHTIVFIVGDGSADGYYLRQSTLLAHALQRMRASVTFLVAPGGHSWSLWTTLFTRAAPLVEPT